MAKKFEGHSLVFVSWRLHTVVNGHGTHPRANTCGCRLCVSKSLVRWRAQFLSNLLCRFFVSRRDTELYIYIINHARHIALCAHTIPVISFWVNIWVLPPFCKGNCQWNLPHCLVCVRSVVLTVDIQPHTLIYIVDCPAPVQRPGLSRFRDGCKCRQPPVLSSPRRLPICSCSPRYTCPLAGL